MSTAPGKGAERPWSEVGRRAVAGLMHVLPTVPMWKTCLLFCTAMLGPYGEHAYQESVNAMQEPHI